MAGITELYDDKETCQLTDCDVMKGSYPYSFMNNDVNLYGNDNYHKLYRQYMFDYIYGNEPLDDVLKKVENLSKIYTFSLKTDDSYIGLFVFIIFLIFFTIITISIVFVFIKKLEYRFRFISKNLWVITTLGSLIIMSSIVTLYGDVTNAKCHLRMTLINVGFILSICPSLHKLLTNFPRNNNFSSWISVNKYIFIIIVILFTLGLNEIFAMSSYSLNSIVSTEGKQYTKCVINSIFGSIIYYIMQIYNFSIIVISLALIFMEWNLKETSLDVKYLATAFFMDTISFILLIIFDKIEFKSYILYNVVLAICILLFSISNHIFIYLVRILPLFRPSSKYEDQRKYLGKLSGSGLKGSRRPSMGTSSFNKRSMSNSTFSKNSMAYYSNLANSAYNKMGTSSYNHTRTPSSSSSHSHTRTTSTSSHNHMRSPSSSSHNNVGTSSYNSVSSSAYNNVGTSSYNKRSMSNSPYNKPAIPPTSYNRSSSKNFDTMKSFSSSTSNDSKRTGFTRKIMSYHNQTQRSFD